MLGRMLGRMLGKMLGKMPGRFRRHGQTAPVMTRQPHANPCTALSI